MWEDEFKSYNDQLNKMIDNIDPTKINKTKAHNIIDALNIFSNWCRKQIFILSQDRVVFMDDIYELKFRIEDNKELVALIKELGSL
jgi:ADP-glucose pyrophosphorylase